MIYIYTDNIEIINATKETNVLVIYYEGFATFVNGKLKQ